MPTGRDLLTEETRGVQVPVAPGFVPSDKVRLGPTAAEVLRTLRPYGVTAVEQVARGAIQAALIDRIMAWDLRVVHDAVGKLIGLDPPNGKSPRPRLPSVSECARRVALIVEAR